MSDSYRSPLSTITNKQIYYSNIYNSTDNDLIIKTNNLKCCDENFSNRVIQDTNNLKLNNEELILDKNNNFLSSKIIVNSCTNSSNSDSGSNKINLNLEDLSTTSGSLLNNSVVTTLTTSSNDSATSSKSQKSKKK